MSAQDEFTAAATSLAWGYRPGRHVVTAVFCTSGPPHPSESCPSCAFHEARYSGDVRRLDRLHAALPALSALFEECAAFVAEYPDLGREHVDGEPCSDYACQVVTRLRSIAQAVVSPPKPTTPETDR